jgi:membrane protein
MKLTEDVLPLLKETWTEFQNDEAGQLGAALSYYAMFSLFPLLILLIAVLGFVLRFWDPAIAIQEQILIVVGQNFSPALREILEGILDTVEQQAGAATSIGLITLLLGASGVFQQLDVSFNKIWKAPEKPAPAGVVNTIKAALTDKLFSFGMVLAVGFLLLVSLALTAITQALLGFLHDVPIVGGAAGYLAGLAVTLALNTLIFTLLFKYLPDVDVRWRDVWPGALLTALVWEVAKRLLAIYIGRSSYASAYGAVGTVLVLMAWIYFSSQVLFLGAEFTEVYSRRHGSRAVRPEPTPPEPPLRSPQPAARAPLASPARTTGTMALATGAGLLVGMIGGMLAGAIALLLGVRRATSSAIRRLRRTH